MAGERLGVGWGDMMATLSRPRSELAARAVRDLLADCLSTLPALLERRNLPALHFYFATFDGLRRQLFPQALAAYAACVNTHTLGPLRAVVREGGTRWLEVARSVQTLAPGAQAAALDALLDLEAAPTGAEGAR